MKTRLSNLFFFFMIALLLHSYNVHAQRMCHSASRGSGRMGGCSGGVQHHQAGGGVNHPGVSTQIRWLNRGSMKPSGRSAHTNPSNNKPDGNSDDVNNRSNNSNNKTNKINSNSGNRNDDNKVNTGDEKINVNNSHNVNNTVVPRKNIASYRRSLMPTVAEGIIVITHISIKGDDRDNMT